MRRKGMSIGILVAAALTLAACQSGGQPSATSSSEPSSRTDVAQSSQTPTDLPIPGLSADNYPRVDGSTANMPLMAQVYSTVCGVPLENAETMVQVSKTNSAWQAIADGNTDLLLVYEPEGSTLEALGSKLDIVPLGRDGLVFLVNTDNPVDSLTQDQLRGIYSGATTDWSAVGGLVEPIAAFQRNAGSGSQTMFLKLLMKGQTPMEAPTELVSGMMGALIDSIALYDGAGGAIGYSVFYYAKEMYAKPNLKLLSVDGVAPTAESIGDGSYPLVNDFYVVIRKEEPAGSSARLLRDWLLTEAGKQALTTAGYVPTASKPAA